MSRSYFEPSEKLVKVLMCKTQNNSPLFFRVLVAYYFAKLASMMRYNIRTKDRGEIPVNVYALNLMTSGAGKGHSTNIIEEYVIDKFKNVFLNSTFPILAEDNIARLAVQKAKLTGEDPEDIQARLEVEFTQSGVLAFSFDSGTTAAVKQMRHKLLLANAGSVNLEMDEIGSNLLGNIDVLNTFLELYDVGKIKQKLIKNTKENTRAEEIEGKTPTNMMLFGTPSKLLNGGKTEEEFNSMLETGYARRCIFGYEKSINKNLSISAEELYDILTDSTSEDYLEELSIHLSTLADASNFGRVLNVSKDVTIELLKYKLDCENKANQLREHEEVFKAELAHRYYKALKLAGAYAFIEGNTEVTQSNLDAAITLVEDSGEAFKQILTRERPYERLMKYLVDARREVTQVDLVEDLPFYKGSDSQKKDLMKLAIASGYKNNVVIKTTYSEGIEFFSAEAMDVTDMDKLTISYSTDITSGYISDYAKWEDLYKLVTLDGYHYAAHHFKDGYRNAQNALRGFNLVILDVDEGTRLDTARMLLKDYKALFATTKRHTDKHNRYRIILPLSHKVKMDEKTYSKFMENVFNWVPFEVDSQTKNISRKWESFNGDYEYQEGELLDALLFIPQTRKEEEYSQKVMDTQSLSNLERWFYLNTDTGNRSNMLIKLAYVLVDNGYSIEGVRNSIIAFNNKLKNPLHEDEINNTLMVTIIKAVTKRDMNV